MSMVTTHISYLVISVGVTIWVARTLRKHGMIYLSDKTDSKPEVAESFSNLLIVGFYLINLGFESLALKYGGAATDTVSAIELLSTKIGFVLLCLGAMHFITVMVLPTTRRGATTPAPTAPVRASVIKSVTWEEVQGKLSESWGSDSRSSSRRNSV